MPTSPVDDPVPDRRDEPVVGSAGWGVATCAALGAGWAAAAFILAPAVMEAGAGRRDAPLLLLVATLVWWAAVVVVIRSDLRHFIIPDGATSTVAGLGLLVAAGVPWLAGDGVAEAVLAASGAAATGAVAFMLFALTGRLFRRFGRDALGFGDVKLAGACALWLAPADAAWALEIAALGAIVALVVSRRRGSLRDTPVPFGAFMAPAAWLVFVLAPPLRDAGGLAPW